MVVTNNNVKRIVHGLAITLTKLFVSSIVVKMKIISQDLVNLNGSFDYNLCLAFSRGCYRGKATFRSQVKSDNFKMGISCLIPG